MVWDREKANAAARAYRERNREKVRERDRARAKTPEFRARVRAWRAANADALNAADRDKRRRSVAPQVARQECAARRRQRFVTAMVPSFEELMLDHDAWLESVDLWRLGEEYERLEASPR